MEAYRELFTEVEFAELEFFFVVEQWSDFLPDLVRGQIGLICLDCFSTSFGQLFIYSEVQNFDFFFKFYIHFNHTVYY